VVVAAGVEAEAVESAEAEADAEAETETGGGEGEVSWLPSSERNPAGSSSRGTCKVMSVHNHAYTDIGNTS
jgi:hypothetical protein